MGVSWSRVGIALLALAVALPAATVLAQKGGEGGPIPERETTCWSCHASWPTPLKTFFNILPPPEAGAPVGEPFLFVTQLQGAWVPPKDGPYIVFYEPALDLTGAPSLDFYVDTPPLDVTLTGTIAVDPTQATAPQRSHVVQEIPSGATSLTIVMDPAATGATGADLTLNIYPGASAPTGSPAIRVDAGGRGDAETFTLQGADAFRDYGYGNWTIEAEVIPLDAANPDPTGLLGVGPDNSIDYTVEVDALVESSGERIQYTPTRSNIPKGGGALFEFQLIAKAEPAAGEVVRLTVNTTEYYKHDPGSSQDDYGNVTKSLSAPIAVSLNGPRVVLTSEIDPTTIVAGGALQNGATIDTISEAIGYAAGFLLVSSVWTGGMFGKASRRQLNSVFGTAKRRVAFHNFLSYGIILAASVHTVLFILEAAYHWTLGLIWGSLAVLAMFLLGVTGAFQVQMIRRWNYNTWRWSHYGLAVAAIVFTLVHMALDGVHFGFIQEAIGWDDPLDTRDVA